MATLPLSFDSDGGKHVASMTFTNMFAFFCSKGKQQQFILKF